MNFEISGGTTPVLQVTLHPGEEVVAEAGELAWLRGPVQLRTGSSVGQSQGGFLGAAKRAISGGTFFMTGYSVESGEGSVTFAAKAPGEIREVAVGGGEEWVVHRHGFVCCEPGVQLNVHLQQKLGAGIFGGAGFILQRLSGQGRAFVEMHGDVVEIDLQPGEELRVHPGHVALFDAKISLELATVPGIKNKLFGGDGLFLARLRGPGKVWLQSITLPALAHALQPYIVGETAGEAGAAGGAAALIGTLLKS
ncbi:MAG: TIGR00266 family protein [Actinobacteria bacterium]|nr:TIGR00266 family protein [Actinomycetota bacterium]MBV8563088.1 TIGR00266 family protein [Actinomycetota bacterium]